ncbi:MAG: TlpA disulfide reductase family protein [Kofleriaceae bacterium]
MTRFRTCLAVVAVAATAAVTAVACRSNVAKAACSTGEDCLPAVTYTDINQQEVKADALRDKVVVVNFWATWCGPCKKEIPAFNRTYLDYKDKGVEFLGVLYDNQVDEPGLLNFMSDHEMTYPVIRADRAILEAYQYPRGLPTTFVYDRHGKLLLKRVGPLDEADLKAQLDRALAAN